MLILTMTSRVGYFPISQRKEKGRETLARPPRHDVESGILALLPKLYLFNTVGIFKCIFSLGDSSEAMGIMRY